MPLLLVLIRVPTGVYFLITCDFVASLSFGDPLQWFPGVQDGSCTSASDFSLPSFVGDMPSFGVYPEEFQVGERDAVVQDGVRYVIFVDRNRFGGGL